MKKTIGFMVLMLFIFGYCSIVLAGPDGNSRKGKYTFRKSCRSCHIEDGKAAALNPDSKTQAQWERVFKPGKYEKLQCKAEWEKLSEADRLNIFTYLYNHAYDSPTPAKCK